MAKWTEIYVRINKVYSHYELHKFITTAKHSILFMHVYKFLVKKALTSSQDMLYSANTVRHRAAMLNKCGQGKALISGLGF